MNNPYASTVYGETSLAVQQALPDPYSSTSPGEDYFAVHQAGPIPYESILPNHDYSAVQQLLLNPYSSIVPTHANDNFAAQHAQEYQQQVYNSAAQVAIPTYYTPTGPFPVATTVPTSGVNSQLAIASLPHDSGNNNHNPKTAGKLPKHKPGKECPEEDANCHWHYTGWCHQNPATCPLARKSLQTISYLVLANSLLQFKLLQLPSTPMESGDMLPRAGTRLISLVSASRTLSCARFTHSWLVESSAVLSSELDLGDEKSHRVIQ